MILDTSALLAILQDEPERPDFTRAIAEAASCHLSMASFVEASLVIEARFGAAGLQALDRLLDRARVQFEDVDLAQAKEARLAFSRYGKGRHPAGLNFGDCFAYALARVLGQRLLFKGSDFTLTDIPQAGP